MSLDSHDYNFCDFNCKDCLAVDTRKWAEKKLGFRFNDIVDVWLFEYDGEIDLSLATTDEVAQAKWLYPSEIMELHKQGKFVNTLTYFFDKIAQDK